MKITKRQLKRIIKEEKQKLFKEQAGLPDLGPLHIAIDRLITAMGYEWVASELEGIADEVRMNAKYGSDDIDANTQAVMKAAAEQDFDIRDY